MVFDIVARKIEIAKANNNGLVPHGALNDIVTQMKPTLPWLTKEMLRSMSRSSINSRTVNQCPS
jgi:hypothetical protein